MRGKWMIVGILGLGTVGPVSAQEVIRPDLSRVATEEGWRLFNRSATQGDYRGEAMVTLDARQGSGIAWLEGVELENGTIDVMIRGKNEPQRSFLGVAFRGVDDQTYDAVYFRPFNFPLESEPARSHHVQYVSHPENTWSVLRRDHEGVYENGIERPPDPDGFFSARIVIDKPEIRVYVDGATEPSLVVQELTDRIGGRIGLFVGSGSDGSFTQLRIRPDVEDGARHSGQTIE